MLQTVCSSYWLYLLSQLSPVGTVVGNFPASDKDGGALYYRLTPESVRLVLLSVCFSCSTCFLCRPISYEMKRPPQRRNKHSQYFVEPNKYWSQELRGLLGGRPKRVFLLCWFLQAGFRLESDTNPKITTAKSFDYDKNKNLELVLHVQVSSPHTSEFNRVKRVFSL